MVMSANGIPKLIEECGELQQILGKRLAYWHTDVHPDGLPIRERMLAEMGDVLAALEFVAYKYGLNEPMRQHARSKFTLFLQWDQDPENNLEAIDGLRVE